MRVEELTYLLCREAPIFCAFTPRSRGDGSTGANLSTGGLVDLFLPAPLTPLRSASGICDLKGRGENGRQRKRPASGGHG